MCINVFPTSEALFYCFLSVPDSFSKVSLCYDGFLALSAPDGPLNLTLIPPPPPGRFTLLPFSPSSRVVTTFCSNNSGKIHL